MTKKLNIGILHYHWLRGGVYTVVNNNLKSLIAHSRFNPIHIDLISRDAGQTTGQNLTHDLQQWAKQQSKSSIAIRPVELPLLDYQTQSAENRILFTAQAQTLSEQIYDALNLADSNQQSPYILNPHNANLGKNPFLTKALALLAQRIEQQNLPIRILYQMHDFAEDHRPHCWQSLRGCTGGDDHTFAVSMMYPANPSIHWVTINSADKVKLESTGLQPQSISVLPNAVEIETFTQTSLLKAEQNQLKAIGLKSIDFAEDLRQRIAAFAVDHEFTFDSKRKMILSPIKVLRRKNVIESILLLLWLNAQRDEHQLMITLNANSQEDIAYSQAIADVIRKNKLPVIIGFGHQLAGPQAEIEEGQVNAYGLIDLMTLSDCVLTTSIQEGFGYVFHEPWLAHKAVLGRNIDMVTSDFAAQGLHLDHLYEHLLIPQAWLGKEWIVILQSYCQKMDGLRRQAGLSPISSHRLETTIAAAKEFRHPDSGEALVDFADLNFNTQLNVIKKVTKASVDIRQTVPVNKNGDHHPHWYQPSNSAMIENNRQKVIVKYSLTAQARQMECLLAQGIGQIPESSPTSAGITNEPIFEQSLAAKNIRLLI